VPTQKEADSLFDYRPTPARLARIDHRARELFRRDLVDGFIRDQLDDLIATEDYLNDDGGVGDCATCENNDADVAGDSGACVMGHGLCDPPQKGCLDYVPANAESEGLT